MLLTTTQAEPTPEPGVSGTKMNIQGEALIVPWSEAARFRLGRRGSQTSLQLRGETKNPPSLKAHLVLLCEAAFSPSLLSKAVKRPRTKGAWDAEQP